MIPYRCIAKLKLNDVQAFNLLDPPLRRDLAPIFELVRMSDHSADPDEELKAATKLLVNGLEAFDQYAGEPTATVDLDRFPPGLRIYDKHPAQWGYETIFAHRKRIIPVVSDHADAQAQAVVFGAARQHGCGLCVRIDGNDLVVNVGRVVRNLISLVRTSELPSSEVDLLIDFGALGRHSRDAIVLAVVSAIATIDSHPHRFRSITLAGASTVTFVSAAVPEEHDSATVRREEMAIWTRVSRMMGWQRGIQFADYGIVHPLDAGVPNKYANGKVRYTAGSGILYLRGCQRTKMSFIRQHSTLIGRLVARSEYRGSTFSEADRFFSQVAEGNERTGDRGRWVCLDMNHHLTYVARQVMAIIASTDAVRASEGSVDALVEAF